ncbi:T9SS type A sorting domain-containing protein [Euzebyella saccharophila]|uniref:T9SS type A sorting domain-containing protein n=1 Tax=Euzebyella saccharophila TaxID=679664 RepID=A0ABV8JUK7_9FLAO|nr:T9SS type A sorting domain-containing protein [Euzebyella saccharophila]
MKLKWFLGVILLIMSLAVVAQEEPYSQQTPKPQKVKVFPNPATNVVNIIGLTNSDKANITIYDIYGNPIFSRQWEIRKHALSIPVSSLEAGAYIITINSNQQNVRTKFYKK